MYGHRPLLASINKNTNGKRLHTYLNNIILFLPTITYVAQLISRIHRTAVHTSLLVHFNCHVNVLGSIKSERTEDLQTADHRDHSHSHDLLITYRAFQMPPSQTKDFYILVVVAHTCF